LIGSVRPFATIRPRSSASSQFGFRRSNRNRRRHVVVKIGHAVGGAASASPTRQRGVLREPEVGWFTTISAPIRRGQRGTVPDALEWLQTAIAVMAKCAGSDRGRLTLNRGVSK